MGLAGSGAAAIRARQSGARAATKAESAHRLENLRGLEGCNGLKRLYVSAIWARWRRPPAHGARPPSWRLGTPLVKTRNTGPATTLSLPTPVNEEHAMADAETPDANKEARDDAARKTPKQQAKEGKLSSSKDERKRELPKDELARQRRAIEPSGPPSHRAPRRCRRRGAASGVRATRSATGGCRRCATSIPGATWLLMAEVMSEASYVRHHKQKFALVFSGMRQLADRLREAGRGGALRSPGRSRQYPQPERRGAARPRRPAVRAGRGHRTRRVATGPGLRGAGPPGARAGGGPPRRPLHLLARRVRGLGQATVGTSCGWSFSTA